MKILSAFLCLTFAVLLFSAGEAWSADFQKGLTAYDSGDYATALREWKPLAEQGNAGAQHRLGNMYVDGDGVPQDYKTAVKWYRLAAEQGYASAQRSLGFAYEDGRGVPQDYKTAVKWYRLAAEQGNAVAQIYLKQLQNKITQGTTEYSDFQISRIQSCLIRLERYANSSKNIMPDLPETFQKDFSKGYLFAAIPDFYKQKEKFKSEYVEKKNQIDQADLSIKTINSWFDAMDCTRDLLSYGIMKDKIR